MKREIAIRLSLLLCGLISLAAASPGKDADEDKGDAKTKVKHGANGEVTVTLSEATQKRMGLTIEPLKAFSITPEAKAFGHVVDPAPLAAMVAEFASAAITAQASLQDLERAKSLRLLEVATAESASRNSSEEFKRTKSLFDQNNASTRALQTAETNAKRDQLALEAQKATSDRTVQTAEATATRDKLALDTIRAKMMVTWGPSAVEEKEWPSALKSLSILESALIRVEVPAGESLNEKPITARVVPTLNDAISATANLVNLVPSVDSQTQGSAFLYLIKPNPFGFKPGMAVTAYLKGGGKPLSGVLVPRAAVLRADNKTYVYLKTSGDSFLKREIVLEQPTENGWFVMIGLKTSDNVVVTGAQQIHSEELNSAGDLVNGVKD